MVLEKTPESPLDSTEIKPVNLKVNQPWIFVGRTEVEAPVFWSSDANSWLTGKVPDTGKDWRQKVLEDGARGWDGWIASPMQWTWTCPTSGDGEGQRGLACFSPWGHRVRHNWADWTSTTYRYSPCHLTIYPGDQFIRVQFRYLPHSLNSCTCMCAHAHTYTQHLYTHTHIHTHIIYIP